MSNSNANGHPVYLPNPAATSRGSGPPGSGLGTLPCLPYPRTGGRGPGQGGHFLAQSLPAFGGRDSLGEDKNQLRMLRELGGAAILNLWAPPQAPHCLQGGCNPPSLAEAQGRPGTPDGSCRRGCEAEGPLESHLLLTPGTCSPTSASSASNVQTPAWGPGGAGLPSGKIPEEEGENPASWPHLIQGGAEFSWFQTQSPDASSPHCVLRGACTPLPKGPRGSGGSEHALWLGERHPQRRECLRRPDRCPRQERLVWVHGPHTHVSLEPAQTLSPVPAPQGRPLEVAQSNETPRSLQAPYLMEVTLGSGRRGRGEGAGKREAKKEVGGEEGEMGGRG